MLEAKNDVVGVVTANLLRMQEEFNAFRQTSQEMQDFDSRMRMLIDDARNEVLKLRQEESETEICSLVAENTQQKILNDFLESEV